MPDTLSDQEPEYRCARCTRLLYLDELQRYICRPCEARAHKQITELPALFRKLSKALAPSSTNNSDRVSTSRDAPLPVSLHVLDMLGPGGIATQLQAIEDSWRVARGRTLGPRTDGHLWLASWRNKTPDHAIADHTTYLTYNLQWACESYEEIAADLETIRKLHSQAETAIAGPTRQYIVVNCIAEYDDGTRCGADMPIDIAAASTTCCTCGAVWVRDDWVKLHDAMTAAAA